MNKEIKNKLQRGLALTVKESWNLYEYIKTLEQEPILKKIRAEIMYKDGLEEALEIIDKYRAENK